MKQKSKNGSATCEKEKIRRRILLKRNNLSEKSRERKSSAIAARLFALGAFKKAKTVMFFVTHGSEVRTREMIDTAINEGKKVAAPVSRKASGAILAAKIRSCEKDLRKGAYGISEPDLKTCPLAKPEEIDLVIVPGIAFDKLGNRIGFGKGYYDKWLGNFKPKQRIALAYSMQIVKKLPAEAHDLAVGTIVTENEVIKPAAES